ncbi:CBS domain-containing protein [Methylohalobius crimeensis]|uniref:CBS domain-containing protein n=1 Tax=Methylohalobius crimeensis TaxID=244365 RepID=UPI0003B5C070|nr:CBS domain-containing protein [Methylohalobius crimeensis]
MDVGRVMTHGAVTVQMDDPLLIVKDILDNSPFHHLLVVESGILRGVISDRDLLKVLSPRIGTLAETEKDRACLHKKAHQIMTRDPITLPLNADVRDALEIFNQHTISCIPVVNDENKPLGIISWRDLLKVTKVRPAPKSE